MISEIKDFKTGFSEGVSVSADGNYEVSFMCNVLIHHSGEVLWVPPAIYKSSCIIDVEFFPFDDQRCSLTFGSWTYNRDEVKLDFLHADRVDFSEYATSSIWDMMDAPAVLTEDRSRIEFQYRDDWKFVAMVVDRVLLYGFFGITLGGTIGILFSAPTVFERVDEQKHLQKLIQLYKYRPGRRQTTKKMAQK
ncbi:Neurotransmitter-gated ion-channel ligand binding domain protein [Necator americanus]|uniref:Neurotransmitter-gated ion-channel ligand binding domain protein n=1 Tax=Necator americanus TaxID=51031 RepID=W2SYZ7_NECAM|nr:Neurotransmitter-gated ion-channel ligand binding domain protein [Necator americanus]ETN74920.1 Neurotransmitter-gated ion-channel ligand binding domain protein [Necator americanus]